MTLSDKTFYSWFLDPQAPLKLELEAWVDSDPEEFSYLEPEMMADSAPDMESPIELEVALVGDLINLRFSSDWR